MYCISDDSMNPATSVNVCKCIVTHYDCTLNDKPIIL